MTNDRNNWKVWLITGCSQGLGRALAQHALDRGDRVAVTARNRAAVTELAAGYSDRALALELDVTDPESVAAAVQHCEHTFGRIDVLVNNAGYGYLAAIEEGDDAGVRALYDTNVHGVVTVLKAALAGMRARRSGRIVNISSFGGLAAFPATGYYHATKFALEGLSESLAAELQPGDPARAAAAIAATVDTEVPPFRLLLGSDALAGARARLERLRGEIEANAALSASVDLEQR